MVNVIDWILDLFRDPTQAAAFVADPDRAMLDAGVSGVTSAQLAAVASTAVPSLALSGGGDPVVGLQQAVASHYGFAPAFVPPVGTSADLLSNNDTRLLSPETNISDNHSFNLDFGDLTLGDKTTAHGDGAVAIGGSNHGDIVSGDGAVLGNGNTVNNGNIHAGHGSTVTVGDGNATSQGNTTAGGDVLGSHDGTVIKTSGHGSTDVSEGNTTTVHGNQSVTDIHGSGNTTGVDNSSSAIHTSTTDNSVHDSSVHSTSVVDSSAHSSSVVDNSVHDNSAHSSSVFDSSLHANSSYDTSVHDNSIHASTHQETGVDGHLGF
jgi:hypothetical protein